MAIALAGWLVIFIGILAPFESGIGQALWWGILLIWGIGHPLEMAISLPIARRAGISPERAVLMTLVFGLTWWVPVKLGVMK